MVVATDYPFLEIFWTMLIFFAFVVWIWILFVVLADIFRREDASGWVKVLWCVFIIIVPYLGVFVYLIAEHKGMTERGMQRQAAAEQDFSEYVRSTGAGSSPADQIAKAKSLLDAGTITQVEFDQMKQKALAG